MASNSILAGPPLSVKRCHVLLPILQYLQLRQTAAPGCISGKPLESFSGEVSSNLTICSSHSSTVYTELQPCIFTILYENIVQMLRVIGMAQNLGIPMVQAFKYGSTIVSA